MLVPQKARPKPVDVEYMRITEENMRAVADWCGGRICTRHLMGTEPVNYIKLNLPRVNRVDTELLAYVGNVMIFFGRGFKVYTSTAFDKTFDLLDV